ncbi:MAG: hypothetical protein ABL953_04535 [Ilumatobacteraceae bacterium]
MSKPTTYLELQAAKQLALGLTWENDASRAAFVFWIDDAIEKRLVADFFDEPDADNRKQARKKEREDRAKLVGP